MNWLDWMEKHPVLTGTVVAVGLAVCGGVAAAINSRRQKTQARREVQAILAPEMRDNLQRAGFNYLVHPWVHGLLDRKAPPFSRRAGAYLTPEESDLGMHTFHVVKPADEAFRRAQDQLHRLDRKDRAVVESHYRAVAVINAWIGGGTTAEATMVLDAAIRLCRSLNVAVKFLREDGRGDDAKVLLDTFDTLIGDRRAALFRI